MLGKFQFDLAVPALRLLIEVDGRRWHSHPSRKANDRRKDQFAVKEGWTVSRVQYPDVAGKTAAAIHRREEELAATS